MTDSSPIDLWWRWSTWPWRMTGGEVPSSVPPAPASLNQPILPGWVFANTIQVTEANSSAPRTEEAILAAHSYGRQLGRIMDALSVLIDERPRESPSVPALEQFKQLRDEVDEIKAKQAARRIERVIADVRLLKNTNAEEYRRLAAALRAALDE
jgi:hypothetical protein